jgi:hypothetical protein
MSRFHSAIIALLFSLALLACATERPTGMVGGKVSIPAIPLSTDPVLWASSEISATEIDDTHFRVDFDSLVHSRQFHQIDVRVTYYRSSCAENMEVWSSLDTQWVTLERRDVPYGCIPEMSPGTRFISDLGVNVSATLAKNNNTLTFRSDRSRWVKCQLLDLDDRYRRLSMPLLTSSGALAWNGQLYSAVRTFPGVSEYYDSLIVYSSGGDRIRASKIGYYPNGMTWSPMGLWMMHGYHPVRIALCDSIGTELAEFTYPGDKCDSWASSISSGIAWIGGKLVVHDKCDSMLYWIDPLASLQTGKAEISDSTFFTEGGWALAFDGEHLLMVAPGVREYDTQGRFIEESVSPNWPLYGAVWDGEALWLGHNGHGSARSDTQVLSRFLIE